MRIFTFLHQKYAESSGNLYSLTFLDSRNDSIKTRDSIKIKTTSSSSKTIFTVYLPGAWHFAEAEFMTIYSVILHIIYF